MLHDAVVTYFLLHKESFATEPFELVHFPLFVEDGVVVELLSGSSD